MLYAGRKLISPQVIPENQRVRYFASVEECLAYTGGDLYAFNSGMAVHSTVYERVSYDKRLFLDGVDYAFLRCCYEKGVESRAFSTAMHHGFSGVQRQSFADARSRFEHYARDHSLVLEHNPAGYRYLVGKRALHLALIYKRPVFLRIFLHNSPKNTEKHKNKEELL